MNYYQRHIGDILTATIGMTLAERGAYAALLDQYYAHEGPLPLNKEECYRLAAAVTPEERKAVDYVLSKFFKPLADGWNQKRCNEELASYSERSAKASASASVRWCKGNANAMRTHSEGNASHKPLAINHKKLEAPPKKRLAEPTPEHQALADSLGVACKVEFAKYRDWLAANGKRQKDEAAGFRNWIRKAAEFRPTKPQLVEPTRHGSHVPAKLPVNEPHTEMPEHIRVKLGTLTEKFRIS